MNTQTHKLSAGYFFLSLGVLITLFTSVISFLSLVFEALNKHLPDVLNASYQYGYSTYQYDGMRSALATLIIFFPAFLVVSYFWKKTASVYMGSTDEVIRKWLIYIILFTASLVSIVDLVTLVRYFISGEITTRFVFKVLAVLVVAIFALVYYYFELTDRKKMYGFSIGKVSAVKASVLVIIVVFYGFSVMGSPMTQRALRLDDRRVNDLQNIQYQVINYWQQKEKLPATLNDLVNPLTGATLPTPPEFEKGEVYEYNVKSNLTFELCATFSKPMPKGWQEYGGKVYPMPMLDIGVSESPVSSLPGYGINESWSHEAGRTCFERTIDTDIYKPFSKY